jgi:hypothetical protein
MLPTPDSQHFIVTTVQRQHCTILPPSCRAGPLQLSRMTPLAATTTPSPPRVAPAPAATADGWLTDGQVVRLENAWVVGTTTARRLSRQPRRRQQVERSSQSALSTAEIVGCSDQNRTLTMSWRDATSAAAVAAATATVTATAAAAAAAAATQL